MSSKKYYVLIIKVYRFAIAKLQSFTRLVGNLKGVKMHGMKKCIKHVKRSSRFNIE